MLKPEQIQNLNQNNVSIDAQKTKDRVKNIWASVDSQSRDAVLKASGLTKYTVQRTYTLGSISAKLIGGMALVLKINPYYLTGESDDQYNDNAEELFLNFLQHKNIGPSKFASARAKAAAKISKVTRSKPGKSAPVAENAAEKSAQVSHTVSGAKLDLNDFERQTVNNLSVLTGELFSRIPNAKKDKIDKISEEELTVLLNGMIMRARFNGDSTNLLRLIKFILSY